ncbi:MAG: inorganic diphosphatase [Armatimonadetes bacterium]|nr:inorganic diphosphatase [Armatimonadota bacterium]
MLYEDLPIGGNAPQEVNALIEVPKGSSNKYKYVPDGDLFRYDHTLFSPLYYPCDYGWVCGTKGAGQRKPLNILVMSSNPTFAGCLVVARPVGALLMHDSKGEDNKILSVAVADPRFDDVRSLDDLSEHTLLEIQHFFEIYQALEQKEVVIGGWEDVNHTHARILAAAGLPAASAEK